MRAATTLVALWFTTTAATCEVADRVRPGLLFEPESTVILAARESSRRELVADAAAWWAREVDVDWIRLGDLDEADVVVEWVDALETPGHCEYGGRERRVIRIRLGLPVDVEWQALLHEVGHCAAALPHHWSRASIMHHEVPTRDDPLEPGFGGAARWWYGVLRGERAVVRAALGHPE